MLTLRAVGVEDLSAWLECLLGGVEGLLGDVEGRIKLELGAEDGLPLDCTLPRVDLGDGLSLFGLALVRLFRSLQLFSN